jgi:hypothetical protein
MTKYRVLLTTTASTWAEIEIDDETRAEIEADGGNVREYVMDNAQPDATLCHHCSHKLDLGDFELPSGDLNEIVEVME